MQVLHGENIPKILEPRPRFNQRTYASGILYYFNIRWHTSPPSSSTACPLLPRGCQSIYCCFILCQTHPITTLASPVQYSAPPSPSAVNLGHRSAAGNSCSSPSSVPHPKGGEVEEGRTQGIIVLHQLSKYQPPPSRFVLG